MIGKRHNVMNSGIHPSSFFKDLWETALSGQIWHGEIANRAKDGSIFWLDTYIYPMMDMNGKIYQFLSVRFDVTERKMREEQEKQFYGLVTVGENAASILHEVMNPLSIVAAKLEIFKRELQNIDNPHLSRHLEGMEKGVKRISQVFQDMRSMIHGNMDFKQNKIQDVLEKVRAFILMKLHKNKVQFTFKGDLELEFFGNEGYLLQVLVNLISNSIDAIQVYDERWVEIEVLESEKSEILVSVTDCGPGIPAEVSQKIFDSLYTTKKQNGGTGLGLSLSRRLIQSMNGEIVYNSSSPHTRFDIFLNKYADGVRYKTSA
ncbi:MAG: hypothetical protein OHK0056_09580 [Bacteriovoracaceae bacterium]